MGAKFRYLGNERGIVFIEDLDQGMSVTNDAENVWMSCKWLFDDCRNLDIRAEDRLVYKDTAGEWWEMIPSYVDAHGTGQHSDLMIEFKRWHGHVWDELNRVE